MHILRAHAPMLIAAAITIIAAGVLIASGSYYVSRVPVLFFFALFVLAGLIIISLVRQRTEPRVETFFLALFIPLSLFCLIAIPPFSTPDAYEHFLRSYEISQGKVISEIAYVDVVETEPVTIRSGILYSDANLLPVGADRQLEHRTIIEALDTEVDNSVQTTYAYSTQSAYSPIAFAPSAFGIAIARLFSPNVWVMVFFGRLFTLLFSGILLYLAIRIIPFGKSVMALLALLPISLELYASMAPDAIIISVSFLFFSYVLRAAVTKSTVNTAILAAFMIGIALIKIVYLPLCLLVFLIPGECFKRAPKATRILLFAAAVLVNLLWLSVATGTLIEYRENVNAHDQVMYMLSHPIDTIYTMLITLLKCGGDWILQIFGSSLNSLNAFPPIILPLLLLVQFVWVCASAEKPQKLSNVSKGNRMLLGCIVIATVLLIFLSIYVQWTPVGLDIVEGIQGRYFIPLLPFALLAVGIFPDVSKQSVWPIWFCLVCLIFIAPLEVAF